MGYKKNKMFLLRVFIMLGIGLVLLSAASSVFIKRIVLQGDADKKDIVLAKPLLSKYENRYLTLKQIEDLKERLNKLFKKHGRVFTKVLLPPQKIKNSVLVFVLVKAKISNIAVYGNKYYSSKFIKNNLNLKKGDYLNYDSFMKSLLLLNEYQDLKVKAYLKKGKNFGETRLNLDVNDSRPFHGIISYDNLGSKSTSKERVSADVFYGNLLSYGDSINLHTTVGIKDWSTKLYKAVYDTKPFGSSHIRFNTAYLYANYVITGTFSVLDIKGNTRIFIFGATRPFLYTTVNRVKMMLNFKRQDTESYLLGGLSSKDAIKSVSLSGSWRHSKIFYGSNVVFSVSRGWGGNEDLGSRFKESKRFIIYNLNSSFNLYSNNVKHNFLVTFNAQYTSYRLPLSDMFSIGGLNSVRGFEPSVKLGDSGYTASFEWFYRPQIKNRYFKNSVQLGLFVDDGMTYVNNPVPGEIKTLNIVGGGGEVIMNIQKTLSARVGIGFPLHSSYDVQNDNKIVYMILNAKLW